MSSAKEERNRKIFQMFLERRREGKRAPVALAEIHDSQENRFWCLSLRTLTHIVYDKNYGKGRKLVSAGDAGNIYVIRGRKEK